MDLPTVEQLTTLLYLPHAANCTGTPTDALLANASWPSGCTGSHTCAATCDLGYVAGDDGVPTVTCTTNGSAWESNATVVGSCLPGEHLQLVCACVSVISIPAMLTQVGHKLLTIARNILLSPFTYKSARFLEHSWTCLQWNN
jgi:hypothetical protein